MTLPNATNAQTGAILDKAHHSRHHLPIACHWLSRVSPLHSASQYSVKQNYRPSIWTAASKGNNSQLHPAQWRPLNWVRQGGRQKGHLIFLASPLHSCEPIQIRQAVDFSSAFNERFIVLWLPTCAKSDKYKDGSFVAIILLILQLQRACTVELRGDNHIIPSMRWPIGQNTKIHVWSHSTLK